MKKVILAIFLLSLALSSGVNADEPPTYDISFVRQNLGTLNGQRIRLHDVVCFAGTGRFSGMTTFVQDQSGGAWSGADIYDSNGLFVADRGDTIIAVGIVNGSDGVFSLDISNETQFPPVITGTGQVAAPAEITCDVASETMYQSCLIKLINIRVMADPDQYGNIEISDDTGSHLLLLSIAEPVPAIGTYYDWIMGLNDYHFGDVKLRPRDPADWQINVPPTVTAYEIQTYTGVQEGDRVRFEGICTVESSRFGDSMTVASDLSGGAWSGITIYDGVEQRLIAERGELVKVVGYVGEYYDSTELNCVDELQYPPLAKGEFGTLPDPVSATVLELNTEESLESCIIILRNIEIVDNPDTNNYTYISDGTAVGKLGAHGLTVGDVYDCLVGLDYYDSQFGEFVLRPRDEDDFSCACDTLGVTIGMPGDDFGAGDLVNTVVTACNPGSTTYDNLALFAILNVFGEYFFYPSFGEFDYETITLPPGEWDFIVLPDFNWPQGVTPASGIMWHAGMTNSEMTDVVGEFDTFMFGWH